MNEIKFPEYPSDVGELEKLKIAYVLNMCTISVSQIVDYNDEYILEQEYDAILNNLNLEQMPKDEPLLNVLTELLDTITFFRIYEKKKAMIDRKYQNKMKNAIWDAVPNFGMLVAGGNWVTAAIGLASNVGIGYMNYRKSKAENSLSYESDMLELQITAIEQLNALRRELFTTSWKLAEKYEFSDRYRLTERQIKQYDEILMDPDVIRRYNRLYDIRQNFMAYPPFWYYLGNAANQISRIHEEAISEEFCDEYKKIAGACFEYFIASTERFSILRDDELVSSCALEYVDILPENMIEKKSQLLEIAMKWSGQRPDILQLCAVDYLILKDYDSAEQLFLKLVNESYNADINSQILSSIYAFHYFETKSPEISFKHMLLDRQQKKLPLFPLPIQENEGKNELQLWNEFIYEQTVTVKGIYHNALNAFFADYAYKLNKQIFTFDYTVEYPRSFFQADARYRREEEAARVFASSLQLQDYLEQIKKINYPSSVVALLNQMLEGLQNLPIFRLDEAMGLLEESISDTSGKFETIQECISTGNVTYDTYQELFEKVAFDELTERFQELLHSQADEYLESIKDMKDIITAESMLEKFGEKNSIVISDNSEETPVDANIVPVFRIDPSLVGRTAISFDVENQRKAEILDYLKSKLEYVVQDADKVKIYYVGTEDFNTYFDKPSNILAKNQTKENLRQQALAVIDDTTFVNHDLVLTYNSIVSVLTKAILGQVKYNEATWNDEKKCIELGKLVYRNKNVDLLKLARVIEDVANKKNEE